MSTEIETDVEVRIITHTNGDVTLADPSTTDEEAAAISLLTGAEVAAAAEAQAKTTAALPPAAVPPAPIAPAVAPAATFDPAAAPVTGFSSATPTGNDPTPTP